MPYNTATLFDDASPNGDEYLLLDDLVTLVALGLLEERPTPERPRLRAHRARPRGACVLEIGEHGAVSRHFCH